MPLEAALALGFELERVVEGFSHREGRGLTGYVDGTENPEGDEAVVAAMLANAGEGLDGSSYVALQVWRHDFDVFSGYPQTEQDHITRAETGRYAWCPPVQDRRLDLRTLRDGGALGSARAKGG